MLINIQILFKIMKGYLVSNGNFERSLRFRLRFFEKIFQRWRLRFRFSENVISALALALALFRKCYFSAGACACAFPKIFFQRWRLRLRFSENFFSALALALALLRKFFFSACAFLA